jgi:TetR/AcrR family fatty acid metabolism transcriptional regulator
MEDVAIAAGVGKGTIYRYFSTKDDLFVQAVIWASDRAIAHLRAHLERAADTRGKLREAIRHTLRYFKENDALFHMLHHDKVNHTCKDKETIDRKRDEIRGVMETLITDGIAEGAFRPVDAHFCAAVLWGILRTAKSWFGDMELSELTDRIASLFLEGVEA